MRKRLFLMVAVLAAIVSGVATSNAQALHSAPICQFSPSGNPEGLDLPENLDMPMGTKTVCTETHVTYLGREEVCLDGSLYFVDGFRMQRVVYFYAGKATAGYPIDGLYYTQLKPHAKLLGQFIADPVDSYETSPTGATC